MFESVSYPLDVIAYLKKKKKFTSILPFKKALGYGTSLIASESEHLLIYILNIEYLLFFSYELLGFCPFSRKGYFHLDKYTYNTCSL